jgi:hypothetical protein
MLNSKRLKVHVVYTGQEHTKWPEVVSSRSIRVRAVMEMKDHTAEVDMCVKPFFLRRRCKSTSEKGREFDVHVTVHLRHYIR